MVAVWRSLTEQKLYISTFVYIYLLHFLKQNKLMWENIDSGVKYDKFSGYH